VVESHDAPARIKGPMIKRDLRLKLVGHLLEHGGQRVTRDFAAVPAGGGGRTGSVDSSRLHQHNH
jgi:hypothetical protein